MKVLITGGNGFIGQHLRHELENHGHRVFVMDHRHNDNIYWEEDIRTQGAFAKFLDFGKPDVVIHLAARVGRLFGEDNVLDTISDNAGMTATVAQACGERNIRLMYASTSEVYGDRGEVMCMEDDPFVAIPHNMYGLSKRWGEEVCRLYAPEGLTIMRFSMPYGPGLPAGRGRAAIINFLYQALHQQEITVHRGGERAWCWVGDTVRAVRLLLETKTGGAFNIGRDDNPRTMLSVAQLACRLTGAPLNLIREVDPPERQTVVKRLSTEKLRGLGWEPEVELEDGMSRVLQWVKQKYPLAA